MPLYEIFAIAFGLAMDAFAVSIATYVALYPCTGRHILRMASAFGLFQAVMPLVGWFAGRTIAAYISAWDHWLALALLSFVGIHMILESRAPASENPLGRDPTRGVPLLLLSVATSLDALAVGLSLAFLEVTIWVPCLIIGLVTWALSSLGVAFGGMLGRAFGRKMTAVGGIVLVLIGLHILASHIL